MVRHERRSMAATTPKMIVEVSGRRCSQYILLVSIVMCLCFALGHHCTVAMDIDTFENYDEFGVGRTAHEPRFGERLLPLRKNNAKKNIRQGKELIKFLQNRNKYDVSHESDVKTGDYNRSKVGGMRETHSSDTFTLTVETLDNHMLKSVVEAPQLRNAKQLNRREDLNILDVRSMPVANVSKADRLVEMSTEFFLVPMSSTVKPHSTSDSMKGTPRTKGLPNFIQPSMGPRSVLIVAPKTTTVVNYSSTQPSIVSTHANFTGMRKEPWVVPVLVLASLTMLMMAAFEIFVLFKAWRTSPSRRHLFLGQMLLLGLFACAALGTIIIVQPSPLSCGTIRFGVGVAYALVFAALLVKCVFLISLNGGVYLPAPYQGLLLLFAVLIQVAIGAQWLITSPPEIFTLPIPYGNSSPLVAIVPLQGDRATTYHDRSTVGMFTHITSAGSSIIPLCKTQFSEFLFSLIYIIFLIVFVAVLAIKSRGIRDNYREATYIGLAIGGAIPIWLGWMLCGLAVSERHKDACIAFGLVATAATVFLVMFMPKGRQLAAMGKEGLYVEDREEQFSSLSRGGSGYSPSFFHFKPIKYGVMSGGGPFQNTASNCGNGANLKHSSNGLSAEGITLVTAAPPSYTRMYHYFPAHLTAHPFCFYPTPTLAPAGITQLPAPPTLKHLGNSINSMTQTHLAQTVRYPGIFIRPDETNLYTTLEPTLSSNPNVYFQRGGTVHPGMMY